MKLVKLTRILGQQSNHDEKIIELESDYSFAIIIDTVVVKITRESIPVSRGFVVDAGAYVTDNEIEVVINIDPTKEPQVYSKLNAVVQDAVRHEIEHLTQGGDNRMEGKPKLVGSSVRDKISVKNGNSYKYFLLRDEIPAMVHGMYRQAKKEKRPLDDIYNEYLDYFVEENVISKAEASKILKTWLALAKKELPAAIYSNED
jgi:hypothetical protein